MRLARLLLLFLATLTLGLPAQAQQRRVALLIGNASYAVGPLRNPPNDVRVMDEALRAVGFQTQVVLNANQNTMKRAVRDFGARAQGADVAFFYYSGHGTQAGGENYLIPLQASIDKESDYEVEAVSANAVLRQIAGARPKAAVVVLDACRDNPLAALAKTGAKGLVRMEAPTGTLIAFATAPNTTASDEGHYARVLGAQLRKPGVELLDAFRNTTAEVLRLSDGRQEPRVSEVSITDRIFLAGTQVASIRPEPVTPGLDLADLHQQASQKAENERREKVALARMQSDFEKVAGFTGTAELQVRAWERFLATWSESNAPSAAGRALRRQAEAKLAEARKTVARPEPVVNAGISKPSGPAVKIGYVDASRVLRQSNVAKAATQRLELEFKEREARLKRAGSTEDRANFDSALKKRKDEELAVVVDQANRQIRVVFESQGFDLIVQDAVNVAGTIDITEQIIAMLDGRRDEAARLAGRVRAGNTPLRIGYVDSERVMKDLESGGAGVAGVSPEQALQVANRAIRALAEAAGYDIILQDAIHAAATIDVTDRVLAEANPGKGRTYRPTGSVRDAKDPLRLGYVNSEKVLRNARIAREAESRLEREFSEWDRRIKADSQGAERKRFNDALAKRKEEELKLVVGLANRVLKDLFTTQHYDLIIQDAMHASASVDITDEVIRLLDKQATASR